MQGKARPVENAGMWLPVHSAHLHRRLADLRLPPQLIHVLESARCSTVGDLLRHVPHRLEDYRDVGRKGVTELQHLLNGMRTRTLLKPNRVRSLQT